MATGVWFRKCLRLHDNAALVKACADGGHIVPFFVLDPAFDASTVGANRYNFLLQSLADLEAQLAQKGSHLIVIRGKPVEVIEGIMAKGKPFRMSALYFEKDSEPYAKDRDSKVVNLAQKYSVRVERFNGHTILDLEAIGIGEPGFKPPIDMAGIQKLLEKHFPKQAGKLSIPQPLQSPSKVPPLPADVKGKISGKALPEIWRVPEISKFYSVNEVNLDNRMFNGGETEALKILSKKCADVKYICSFEKPKTPSTNTKGEPGAPATTGLSPYLKFGCLSVRKFWWAVQKCYEGRAHSSPPQSLHGQLYFREMFYVLSASVPNWDKAEGNPMCKPIEWKSDSGLFKAWRDGITGYPYIDALMRQLKQTGWMHHLGRHACACFLTRGDLYQSWTKGRDVFDLWLLDADWALNNGNWLWLSGVAPFSMPFFRVYDPSPGKDSALNAEQEGEFIKHWCPELCEFPSKYIYKPWEAPVEVQRKANCIIGKDYPKPVVDHAKQRDANLKSFKNSLDKIRSGKIKVASMPTPTILKRPAGAGSDKEPSSTTSTMKRPAASSTIRTEGKRRKHS